MNTDPMRACDQEAAVLAALDASTLVEAHAGAHAAADAEPSAAASAALAAHVRGCAACQEAIAVWRHLRQEADELMLELDETPMRHPGLIWWRRRILDQQAAAHRLLQPIAVFQIAAGFAGLLALGALLFFLWPSAAAAPSARTSDGAFDLRLIGLTAGLALAALLSLGWATITAIVHRRRG